jgi:hypothetical protein
MVWQCGFVVIHQTKIRIFSIGHTFNLSDGIEEFQRIAEPKCIAGVHTICQPKIAHF